MHYEKDYQEVLSRANYREQETDRKENAQIVTKNTLNKKLYQNILMQGKLQK